MPRVLQQQMNPANITASTNTSTNTINETSHAGQELLAPASAFPSEQTSTIEATPSVYKPPPTRSRKFVDLSDYDDLLSDWLLDELKLGFRTHKMNPDYFDVRKSSWEDLKARAQVAEAAAAAAVAAERSSSSSSENTNSSATIVEKVVDVRVRNEGEGTDGGTTGSNDVEAGKCSDTLDAASGAVTSSKPPSAEPPPTSSSAAALQALTTYRQQLTRIAWDKVDHNAFSKLVLHLVRGRVVGERNVDKAAEELVGYLVGGVRLPVGCPDAAAIHITCQAFRPFFHVAHRGATPCVQRSCQTLLLHVPTLGRLRDLSYIPLRLFG